MAFFLSKSLSVAMNPAIVNAVNRKNALNDPNTPTHVPTMNDATAPLFVRQFSL